MWIRELLNDRKWHHDDLGGLLLEVRHRGARDDVRRVAGGEIREIAAGGLVVEASPLHDDEETLEDGTVFLPYHRVLRVVASTGTVLWQRPQAAEKEEP